MKLHPAAILLLLPLLAACPADMSEHDYRISHPISAELQHATAIFDRPEEGAGLSAFDRDRLGRLAAESLRRGAGAVEVTIGTRPGEEAQSLDFAQVLASGLRQGGVAVVEITAVSDQTSPGIGVARVRVPVWSAVVPECGTFERGLNPDHTNAPHSNWGCSIQRNKAMMVQNPGDLIRARDSSGRDANRASDVLDKYDHGKATGSEAEVIKQGSTSSVGGK